MPDVELPTLAHVLNNVGVDREHHLWLTQQVTFEGMHRARSRFAGEVEFVGIGFAEDASILPEQFRFLPALTHSILDVAPFAKQRKLPFLADILTAAHRNCDADYLIFTNADIIPGPDFYTFVAERVSSGLTSFTINRRTVPEVGDPLANFEEIVTQRGTPHPGHDCFVFPREWVPKLDLGRIVVGIPWIGFTLLLNLAACGGVEVLTNEFQTFHVGDDRVWLSPEDRAYRDFQTLEAVKVMTRTLNRNPQLGQNGYISHHIEYAKSLLAHPEFAPPRPRSLAKPRKIFAISSGRAGSEYLQTVLASAEKTLSFHEPQPAMNGIPLQQAMAGDAIDIRLLDKKLDTIDRLCDSLPPAWAYVETNHMFIKTFADAAVRRWPEEISVIRLRRNLVDVLLSFVRLGYFSERNSAWPAWMHRVPSALSLVPTIDLFENMDPIDRSIAYLLDIEALGEAFERRHAQVDVVHTSLEQLQSHDRVVDLMERLGLDPTAGSRRVTGKRINARAHVKQTISADIDRGEAFRRLERWLELDDPNVTRWIQRDLAVAGC